MNSYRFIVTLLLFIVFSIIVYQQYVYAADKKFQLVSSEDEAFIDNIVTLLKDVKGKFEYTPDGPYIMDSTGIRRVGKVVYKGDNSIYLRLGEIIDKHQDISHGVITKLVDCLDNTELTNTIYRDNNIPLGVMCYEALSSICYYECHDGECDHVVLVDATESDLKKAKKAWLEILRTRKYIML